VNAKFGGETETGIINGHYGYFSGTDVDVETHLPFNPIILFFCVA
jgi:hypothetical protein